MRPIAGESVRDFAERLYYMQMEVYSAWAGCDLDVYFGSLPKKTIEGWMRLARRKMSEGKLP